MVVPCDAWFSQKMLNVIEHFSIYADAKGNQYLCTAVSNVGTPHGCNWDDMVYLGTMVKYVKSIEKDVFSSCVIPANVRTKPLSATVNSAKAINDYVCPACNNDKCSKTEKSCWKCGFRFSNG